MFCQSFFFEFSIYRKLFFSHRFYNVNLPQDMSVAFLKNVVVSEFFWHFYYMPPFQLNSISEFLSFVMKQLQGIFFMNSIHFLLKFGNIVIVKQKKEDTMVLTVDHFFEHGLTP